MLHSHKHNQPKICPIGFSMKQDTNLHPGPVRPQLQFRSTTKPISNMTLFAPPSQTTLHYRLVTPMFLGGEGQQVDPTQFRNASFKGALRFWWRALNWGAAQKDSAPLQWLHAREGALFGLASDGKDSKQSRVQIQSDLQKVTLKQPGMGLKDIGYLLGQGLYSFSSGVTRQYLDGGDLTITLRFKPGTSAEDIQSVEQAAIALGLFGGLGSRSRRGLGSLALQTLERNDQGEKEFTTLKSIEEFIKELDFSAPKDAPLSALCVASRIDISATDNTGLGVLQKISKEMQLYRSFGRNNKVGSDDARRNFVADHDAARDATQGKALAHLPQRAVFGLPHNYHFSSNQRDKDIGITAEKEGRRASPLLVHIHPLKDGSFIAIQTLLPGIFLPPGMAVETKVSNRPKTIPDTSVDFNVITRYLDGFPQKQTLKVPCNG